MKLIPLVLASTHPANRAALPTAPTYAIRLPGRASAAAPHAIWKPATAVNAIAACRCSACEPIAAAWMAPALRDATAATRSGRRRAAEGGLWDAIVAVMVASARSRKHRRGRGSRDRQRRGWFCGHRPHNHNIPLDHDTLGAGMLGDP